MLIPDMLIPPPLFQEIEPPRPCSYLPGESATLEYRADVGLSPGELEELVRRGWRRFGQQVFRPACSACSQCVPVRIDVRNFEPSKSQRRTFRKNEQISVEFVPAGLSLQHVELYNAWHDDMEERRDWPEQSVTWQAYAQSFLAGQFPSAHELRYWDGNELMGVGLIDVMPTGLSSIYFYHAPHWRSLGPGTFSLLCEIDLARRLGKDFVYLGYWIAACPSMSYKNRFHPYERLLGRPGVDEEPVWVKECSSPQIFET